MAREKPHAVLIGTDTELPFYSAHRAWLEREFSTKIVVSAPEVVGIADDKYATYLFLKNKGLPYPESSLPEQKDEMVARFGFPLIVKPRRGSRSVGLSVVRSNEDLEWALSTVCDPMIQELVGDDESEYTAGTLCFDHSCEASIVMRRHLKDGNTYRAFVEPFESLNKKVRMFAEALGAYGPANFQFRLDDGELKLFEINARFSGTTPLRTLVGFPEVEMVLRRAVLGEKIEQPHLASKILLRYWSETVISPQELLQSWQRGSEPLSQITLSDPPGGG